MYIIRVCNPYTTDYNFTDDVVRYCNSVGIKVDEEVVSEWVWDSGRISFVAYDEDMETAVGFITGHIEQSHDGICHAWVDGLSGKNCGRELLKKFEETLPRYVKRVYISTVNALELFYRLGYKPSSYTVVKEFNG